MVWAREDKRWEQCRKDGDLNRSTGGQEISGRRDCRGRKFMTEWQGGECLRTLTPA